MFVYKTEILKTGIRWFGNKVDEADVTELDRLINTRAAEGWELVTHSFMATDMQVRSAVLITFRKQKPL